MPIIIAIIISIQHHHHLRRARGIYIIVVITIIIATTVTVTTPLSRYFNYSLISGRRRVQTFLHFLSNFSLVLFHFQSVSF